MRVYDKSLRWLIQNCAEAMHQVLACYEDRLGRRSYVRTRSRRQRFRE